MSSFYGFLTIRPPPLTASLHEPRKTGGVLALVGDALPVLTLCVGVLIGAVLGVAIAPAVHAWVGLREWMEASRELELADSLIGAISEKPADGAEAPSNEEPAPPHPPSLPHGDGR